MTTRTKKNPLRQPIFLWRKFVIPERVDLFEQGLRESVGDRLAVIAQVGRRSVLLEIACQSRVQSRKLVKRFGGSIRQLPRNWEQPARAATITPIKIGSLLVVARIGEGAGVTDPGYSRLVIPAGAAFGTGDHATTAMSLRLLDKLIRTWGAHAPPRALFGASPKKSLGKSSRSRGRDRQHARRVRSPELIVDLGTGSGILALAAKRLGAKRAIGIDVDPIAISTAKDNRRLNKVNNVKFQVADVRRWKLPANIDIVTANLFSELLVEILPRLKRSRWLILSGILRTQEEEIFRAFRRNRVAIVELRRRGKWVALLAKPQ